MKSVLSVQGINKTYGKIKVVNEISFDIHQGEILGILGPNGAGKTTIIRSIMGIIGPDEGTIKFGFGTCGELPRTQIGYLPEERGLYRDVKVMDILLYLASLKNYTHHKARQRVLDYMEKFDLVGKDRVRVQELSKGMAQKVQFIGAIIHGPQLIILDEPFSGLDPVSQDVFRAEIRALADAGAAILLSSHQMNLVEALCDRLFLIHKGNKVIYGDVTKIKEDYAGFKCHIIGQNQEQDFAQIPGVEHVEMGKDRATLFLSRDTNPSSFLTQLPLEIHVQELHLDRISLHDIFVNIATGR